MPLQPQEPNMPSEERAVNLSGSESSGAAEENFFDLVSQITKSVSAVPQHVR